MYGEKESIVSSGGEYCIWRRRIVSSGGEDVSSGWEDCIVRRRGLLIVVISHFTVIVARLFSMKM